MRSVRSLPRRYRWLGTAASATLLAAAATAVIHSPAPARSASDPADPAAQSPVRAALTLAPGCAPGTAVRTTRGPVCGLVEGEVTEWLGIPYAAPPVGSLRWRPPQPHARWRFTRAATAFGHECIQPSPEQRGLPVPQSSENCLFLNVWAPDGTMNDHLPVMVHIHGGGFFAGSGNEDNSLLATAGHEVIVSMNYRLGVFGFLADSALGPHSGDYGLQDQQAALRWVKQNISRFGGNPRNVTIYGESAGGASVCDQIASPTARGLFEKAISTSGEYNTLLGTTTPSRRPEEDLEAQDCKSALPAQATADQVGSRFAAAVGCGRHAASVASCLRRVPEGEATRVSDTPGDGYQYGAKGTIAPTINGWTLTRTLRQALQTGRVNRVPVIAGTDRDENLAGTPSTPAKYARLIRREYRKYAARILALYPLAHFPSPQVAFRTVAADSNTVCPALVTDQALARWMPVYGYEIDDDDPPPYQPTGSPHTPEGAPHVGAWFLTAVHPPLDADQQVLQDQEVAEVTRFARSGNPEAAHTPVWPQFNHSLAEMVLAPAGDSQVMSVLQVMAIHNCGFWSQVAPAASLAW